MTQPAPDPKPDNAAPIVALSAQELVSVLTILVSNALVIAIALNEHWALGTLLWPYWLQSVIIGVFSFRRMLMLRNFSTAGYKVNGQAVSSTASVAKFGALFFAAHYGGFHLVYLFFLSVIAPFPRGQGSWILLAAASFCIGQYYAYRQHLIEDARGGTNIGALMLTPYLRILPMHLIIILGAVLRGSGWALVLFGVLKTIAELLGIGAEKKILAKMSATGQNTHYTPPS